MLYLMVLTQKTLSLSYPEKKVPLKGKVSHMEGVSKAVWAVLAVVVVLIVAALAISWKPAAPAAPTAPAANVTPSPAPSAVSMKTPADTLIIAMDTSDAVSLDPARAYEFTSCFVTNQLYDTLVDFELPDLIHVKPEVAERWEYTPDGLVWTFYIRKGIKFASGNPLTADDVVYSLQRVIKLKQTA